MKHFLLLLSVLITVSLSLSSCHSNEQNYKQAYDKAVLKKKESVDSETLAKIEAEKRRSNIAVFGDSLQLKRGYANVVDNKRDVVKPYSVVIAEFKQLINARAYRDRLIKEEGFEAYILHQSSPNVYLVVVKGFDKLDIAAAFIKRIDDYVKIKIMVPKPWIFQII